MLGPAVKMVKLLRAQLAPVIEDTETAAVDIMSRATSLEGVVGELRSRFSAFVADYDAAERDVQAGLQNYMEAKKRSSAGRRERREAIEEELHRLQEDLTKVLKMAEFTQLLALNARIVAAKSSSNAAGRSFTAVAREVGELAHGSRQAAEQISESVSRVRAALEAGEQTSEYEAETEETALSTLLGQHERMTGTYERLHETFVEAVGQPGQLGELGEMVLQIIGRIQFQDVVRQKVEQVMAGLDALGDDAAPTATDFEAYASGYTMHAQRQTHAAVLDDAIVDDAPAPAIELF